MRELLLEALIVYARVESLVDLGHAIIRELVECLLLYNLQKLLVCVRIGPRIADHVL